MEIMAVIFKDNNTPYSNIYDDIYFSEESGIDEKYHVFVEGNDLPAKFKDTQDFTVLELGFGTGLNFLLTLKLWQKTVAKDKKLYYVAIEKHPLSVEELDKSLSNWPALAEQKDMLLGVYCNNRKSLNVTIENVSLTIIFADVKDTLYDLDIIADAVFLDGFSPDKNADMWTDEVFGQISRLTKNGGTIATYSCAGKIRRGLESAGFKVEKAKGFGRKRHMLKGIHVT